MLVDFSLILLRYLKKSLPGLHILHPDGKQWQLPVPQRTFAIINRKPKGMEKSFLYGAARLCSIRHTRAPRSGATVAVPGLSR